MQVVSSLAVLVAQGQVEGYADGPYETVCLDEDTLEGMGFGPGVLDGQAVQTHRAKAWTQESGWG